MVSSKGKAGQEEFGSVCRVHYGAIAIVDGDWGGGHALVVNMHVSGVEVGGTTGVGDGNGGV